MVTILAAILVLGVLVFIHEFGHFLFAKLFKIRVDRFSLGYPPRMAGKKIGETDYCISWVPFGGYVKIAGMVDESMDVKEMKEEPKPWEFRSKPVWKRMVVIFAGPVINLFFAYVIFTLAVLFYGLADQVPGTVVGSVIEGKPAEAAGLEVGDRILKIDNREISSWDEMTDIIHASPDVALNIAWMRNDTLFSSEIVPVREKIPERGDIIEVGLIGIGPRFETRKAGMAEAFAGGAETLYGLTELILVSLGKLITGQESIRNLAGPVGIAKMAGDSARAGWGTLIGFMAFLSLNFGILNLLPIPVLDGGHLLLLFIEGIIRREIPLKVKMVIQQVFMFLLIGLMIFVVYNDVTRILHK